ncbi:MAG: hypothetical protein K9J37_09055 [Saprospiraceae bacterium]|nr:hypothetical protein [Saprospiraceae bacterium]MCF8250050.1 hypothetical protein [Saprospiraceae bacterium]MCF8279512.1 hypothetical protein [Bacteroidales bacterium]MCF8311984.1 hypothetical protein [Saprospiraceae bacterium]MCF8440326.1 hypothetical protein [Saprospiraceae bacterium]
MSQSNADDFLENDDSFSPKAVRMGATINSVYSDFAPFRFGDRLYFSSAFFENKDAAPVNRVYSTVNKNGPTLWAENPSQPSLNSSNIAFTANGQRAYFTYCEEKKTGDQICEIYTRERDYEGYWLPYKRLPNHINLKGYTSTQPSIGYNRALRQDVLFFASNRPGGMGGMDIWCSPIQRNGTYEKPFPLPFNTAADEVTPFFHQPNQVLFFSSNGGNNETGFDIFKSANTWSGGGDSHWSKPEKLDKPFSSSYDDLYFNWHTGSGKAYFTSNRPGCVNADPKQSCIGYDIFEVDIQTELVAQVFDGSDSSSIMGYKLQLYPMADANAARLPSFTNGIETKFLVEIEKKYRLVATAIGYQPDTLELATNQADGFAKLHQPIYLKPKARLLVRTYNAIDSLPLGGVAMQLSETGSGEKIFVSNKENEFQYSFLVGVGDIVSLAAMKPGFVTTYVKPNAEYRYAPTPDAHLSVYLSPFTEAPVALYFDNDEPKWVNPMDTHTKLTYFETFQDYMARKQVFVEKYIEGLSPDEAAEASEQMNSFFEEEVQTNFARLDRLCSQLQAYLKKGYQLEVLAVGEASPLASDDYNNRLIARRISSVINQLKVWNSGELNQYFDSGQLIVSSKMNITEGEGERVQVKLSDRRQSEYSPEVSKMRKVVIEGVKRQKPKV